MVGDCPLQGGDDVPTITPACSCSGDGNSCDGKHSHAQEGGRLAAAAMLWAHEPQLDRYTAVASCSLRQAYEPGERWRFRAAQLHAAINYQTPAWAHDGARQGAPATRWRAARRSPASSALSWSWATNRLAGGHPRRRPTGAVPDRLAAVTTHMLIRLRFQCGRSTAAHHVSVAGAPSRRRSMSRTWSQGELPVERRRIGTIP